MVFKIYGYDKNVFARFGFDAVKDDNSSSDEYFINATFISQLFCMIKDGNMIGIEKVDLEENYRLRIISNNELT